MQLRGPAENGIYVKGFCFSIERSPRKRSGLNASGSGKYFSLCPIEYIGTIIFEPAGMTRFSAENITKIKQLIHVLTN